MKTGLMILIIGLSVFGFGCRKAMPEASFAPPTSPPPAPGAAPTPPPTRPYNY